jgi:D-alanyl-D-alanine dipeptidase
MSDADYQLDKEENFHSSSIGFISPKSKIIISVSIVAIFLIALIVIILVVTLEDEKIPEDMDHSDFVIVNDVIPDVLLELRYFTSFNFVGARIDGYEEPVALLTKEAAEGLKKASERFKERDLIIKIWDSYRPKSAVDHFVRWSKDFNDYKMKDYFFPDLTKKEVFDQGFVATKSGHSRGSTLDMTLVYKKNGTELDFGTGFDFFGNRSNTNSTLVTEEQYSNRIYLKEIMEESGFENLPEEWWHYTLKNEPFPNTYFNFPVNATLIKQGN